MKQWLETREVLARLAELKREGRRAALATVVRVRGSAYRHEGAKMLVAADGTTTGNVSGGCLEADVREVALKVLEGSGKADVRSYCAGSDEIVAWDLGVGCEGEVQVLLEPAEDDRAVERALLDGTAPFAACASLDEPSRRLVVTTERTKGTLGDPRLDASAVTIARRALGAGSSAVHTIEGRDVFIDVFLPPPRLVIVSGGEDARPLAAFGSAIGFKVIVVDRRPGLLTRQRFPHAGELVTAAPDDLARLVALGPETFAVVMTHNYADDRVYVRALLDTNVAYIGVLGPRQRTDRMLAELAAHRPVNESRIYGPIGLDIGTDGAEQVAISALSEILAVRSGRRPSSLRERRQPIHVDAGG